MKVQGINNQLPPDELEYRRQVAKATDALISIINSRANSGMVEQMVSRSIQAHVGVSMSMVAKSASKANGQGHIAA